MLARIATKQLRRDFTLFHAVVSQDTTLEPSNGYHFGACPFCKEGNDRFKIFTNTRLFYCHVCGLRGDIFEYVQKRQNVDFVTAAKWLGNGDHVVKNEPIIQGSVKAAVLTGEQLQEWQERAAILASAASNHLLMLDSETAVSARKWLQGRGIGEHEIRRHMIGFNPHWRTITSGCKLPPGVTIPRFDSDYNLTAVNVYLDKSARKLTGKKRMFAKGSQAKSFWNGQELKGDFETAVISEGETDAILISRFLCTHAQTVSTTCGGNYTIPDDLSILNDKKVILIFDNDTAGKNGVEKWLKRLPHATAVTVPNGKDVSEFWENSGDEKFKIWLRNITGERCENGQL